MKAAILLLVSVGTIIWCGVSAIKSNYYFKKDYYSEWALADRSSTIDAKREHIENFVNKLESNKGSFAEHNAIFLKTDMNSFQHNLNALKTLSDRLKEISGMDPKSFEYNTAIQQITGQEQGEADALIWNVWGCFELKNYPLAWDWICGVAVMLSVIVGIISLIYGMATWGL